MGGSKVDKEIELDNIKYRLLRVITYEQFKIFATQFVTDWIFIGTLNEKFILLRPPASGLLAAMLYNNGSVPTEVGLYEEV